MAPKTGADAAGVPAETQMLLLETRDGAGTAEDTVYALMLPVLDGDFRASLQGTPEDELQLCFESGMLHLVGFAGFHVNCISMCERLEIYWWWTV
jgi:hypothetical protein